MWAFPYMKYENLQYLPLQNLMVSRGASIKFCRLHNSNFVIHHGFTTKIWCFLLVHHLPRGLLGLHYSTFRIWVAFDKESAQRRLKISSVQKKSVNMTAVICCKDEGNRHIFWTKEVSLRFDNKTGRYFMISEHSCQTNNTSSISQSKSVYIYSMK